ncbi:MAG: hypothetical protein IPL81_14565 [Flavobacteriales bacterium]|nr:hypothetical protein [Flavobacteriales bacterium]
MERKNGSWWWPGGTVTQLLTKSKGAYSSQSPAYGDRPNTPGSAIALTARNLTGAECCAIDHAIKLGLACGCTIAPRMHYARKNYFYLTRPLSPGTHNPICTGGTITITMSDGSEKAIELTRIHMEEDAGKSIHDVDPFNTSNDLNRAACAAGGTSGASR